MNLALQPTAAGLSIAERPTAPPHTKGRLGGVAFAPCSNQLGTSRLWNRHLLVWVGEIPLPQIIDLSSKPTPTQNKSRLKLSRRF